VATKLKLPQQTQVAMHC